MDKHRFLGTSIALAIGLGAAHAGADSFAPGSLIIPMDTTYQDVGMLKAYGLVYHLLEHGVPVRWVILSGKAFQGTDFTASATDHKTSAVIGNHGYRGGPFVVDSADAAKALPLVDAWQAANPATTVHEATSAFTCDVARYLVAAPKVAMHADGNQAIAMSYLNAAGIPDSQGNPWPSTSPDLLTPAEVAGPTTTNHRDGALFDADGDPIYCQFMSMHWGVVDAQANPEVVAEVREYLTSPVHFFAECQAVDAFENLVPYGHFLTPNGFVVKSQPTSVDVYHADVTFAQMDGVFGTVGGSEPAYALPSGDSYKAGGVTMITNHLSPEGTWDLWMTGYLDGACPPASELCGTLGKVSYLGGHQYTTNVPISTNPKTQGVRLFLNSLFDSTCASASGQPRLYLYKTAPATTLSPTVTFTLNYGNSGPTVALSAIASDAIPAGATFVSATGGGTASGGKVTWSLGNLGVGESGTVSFTVTLGAFGTYPNTARLDYDVGLNPFSLASNTTSTVYDKDSDGDGVLDSLDICPTVYDPKQDLTSDVLTCGSCTNACTAPNAVPACYGGTCGIATCDAGWVDCDGVAANGCELAASSLSTDPSNCGACGNACSFSHASASCSGGTCALAACASGYSDCNANPTDGCEYANGGFATDASHCGGCGTVCPAGFVCSAGACVVSTCPSGFSDCDGIAADGCEYANAGFASDASNCGGCNLACAPANGTGACVSGACTVVSCSPGFADCNGLPGDGCEYAASGFGSDANDCGGCNVKCAPANAVGTCSAGACAIASCASGFSDCDGVAADGCEYADAGFATDPSHCGGCGVRCATPNATAACVSGACAIAACAPGWVDLDGVASNGCEYACTPIATNDATCDGVDDDCDGLVDEDWTPTKCGQGACAQTATCKLGAVACVPGLPSKEGPAGDPTCANGVDDDCDGLVDGADPDCNVAACKSDADCDDGDACTLDSCVVGVCVHAGTACEAGASDAAGADADETSGTVEGDDAGTSGPVGDSGADAEASEAATTDGGVSTSDVAANQGSCACRSTGASSMPSRAGFTLLGLAALALARRRRRSERSRR